MGRLIAITAHHVVTKKLGALNEITGRIIPIALFCLLVFMVLRAIFSWKARLHAAQTLRAKLQADSDAYAEAKAAAQATATGGSVYINSPGPTSGLPEGARIVELAGERTRQTALQSEIDSTGEYALPPGSHFRPVVGRPELETIKRRNNAKRAG